MTTETETEAGPNTDDSGGVDGENGGDETSPTTHTVDKVDYAVGKPLKTGEGYRFTITHAVEHAGVDADNAEDSSLLFELDREGPELVAHIVEGETAKTGRASEQWRSIISNNGNPPYRVQLNPKHLERLGFDLTEATTSPESHPLVDVWAGDGIIVFEKP